MESADLVVPELDVLASELERGLKANFAEAWVKPVSCPDLTKPPYSLAAAGLGGRPVLVDVGGVMNLQYVANRRKAHFDIGSIARSIDRAEASFIGPGAGWVDVVPERVNSELIASVALSSPPRIHSRYAVVRKQDGAPVQAPYPHLDFGVLGNFLASDGQPGQVLEVYAAKRTGSDNFVSCMRKTLTSSATFQNKPLALGGAFQIERGRIKAHIMPDFHPCDEFVDPNWHVYFEFHAPLTCVSVFATAELGLDLRMEHTHFYSEHGQGGHYHNDVTPDEVIYHGFYTPCERVYRVARHQKPPPELHVPRKEN